MRPSHRGPGRPRARCSPSLKAKRFTMSLPPPQLQSELAEWVAQRAGTGGPRRRLLLRVGSRRRTSRVLTMWPSSFRTPDLDLASMLSWARCRCRTRPPSLQYVSPLRGTDDRDSFPQPSVLLTGSLLSTLGL
jgi:hypothetical protein